jgi:hypothetical protein
MANEIKVNQALEEAKSTFNNINAAYDSLGSRLTALSGQLEDERWSGRARDKCVDIHELITQYAQSIYSIIAGTHLPEVLTWRG